MTEGEAEDANVIGVLDAADLGEDVASRWINRHQHAPARAEHRAGEGAVEQPVGRIHRQIARGNPAPIRRAAADGGDGEGPARLDAEQRRALGEQVGAEDVPG